MKNKKRCGRLDKHLAHYWNGTHQFLHGKTMIPVYWCSGKVTIEGGHRVR